MVISVIAQVLLYLLIMRGTLNYQYAGQVVTTLSFVL
jgi:hypothetical protein